ncbi:MAG: ketoacyl-ACP synthase III [Nitrospirae bacterium]|nr:ketoacyl-ACP synthase III [Nitrospirota bacterium]
MPVRSRIIGVGSYLPTKILTNHDLEREVDTSDEWILDRTGIRERRIASEEEATSDLAFNAAKEALKGAGIKPEDLDFIIVATVTPDMLFPSSACLVQQRLGVKGIFAFDISAACSGFIYAISVADQYIRSGIHRTGLVIGADTFSRVVDWTDRNTCVLFGDGAGAVVLQADYNGRGIISTHLYSDGTLWDFLYIPGGGSRIPPGEEMVKKRLQYVKMRGNETFKVAVNTMSEAIGEALKSNGLTSADIKLFIPHQANLRIIQAVGKRLNIPMERFKINLDRYGNTSAASIPIALYEAVMEGEIKEDDYILLEAFGGGLTWGSALIRW